MLIRPHSAHQRERELPESLLLFGRKTGECLKKSIGITRDVDRRALFIVLPHLCLQTSETRYLGIQELVAAARPTIQNNGQPFA